MAYNLYKHNDGITPFVIVAENTINSTDTSVFLVGKRKEAYGQAEQQSKLWMLENFADATQPANPILGQAWYNTVDSKLYVCTDENLETFEKVSNPLVAGAAPSLNLTPGNMWFNSVENRLYIWTGAAWKLVGPQVDVPLTVLQTVYLNKITTDATPTNELFLDGVSNSHLVIPANTTWLYEITIVARRTNALGERRSWKFEGMLSRDSGAPTIDGGGTQINLSQTANTTAWSVTVTPDVIFNSLKVGIVGENSKTITWNAVCRLTKVA